MAELTVPTSLYGMVLAEPLVLNRKHDGNIIFFTELLRGQFMLCVNYVIQLLFLFEVGIMDLEKQGDACPDKYLWLQIMCVLVFEVAVFTEIRASTNILALLWHAPCCAGEKRAGMYKMVAGADHHEPESGAILAKTDDPSQMSKRDMILRRVRHPPPQGMQQWTLDGITRTYKFWCFLSIGLPKLAIALLLGYYGGAYIAKSADQETMLLNTLAVMFVIDVDEILYEAFISDYTKDSLEHMKAVEVEVSNGVRFTMWAMSAILYPMIVLAASALTVFYTKASECEGYHYPWQMKA